MTENFFRIFSGVFCSKSKQLFFCQMADFRRFCGSGCRRWVTVTAAIRTVNPCPGDLGVWNDCFGYSIVNWNNSMDILLRIWLE